MSYIFVPEGFQPPYQAKTENFIIRKLTVNEAQKDYIAVMSNKDRLRQVFCDDDDWPSDDMTLEENYQDLLEHQTEFENNEGFAYTILSTDEQVCLGCIYIYPFPHGVYDCRVFYWLIKDADALDGALRQFIDGWLQKSFHLKHPAYPGRDMSHTEWKSIVQAIKAKKR